MDLDRSLSDLADGYRPDRQPSLDDLVTKARARRRTAVVLAAASVLAVAVGVAVAVPRADKAAPRVLVSTPTVTPTGAPAECDLKESGGVIDYIDFVQVGDRMMDGWMGSPETQPVVREADLDEVVTHVTCRLEDHYLGQQAKQLKDGYASFLAEGEPVYAVHGYDQRCRVAARMNGELHVYLASDPDAKVHRNAPCSLMPGMDPDGPAGQPGDLSGAPATFRSIPPLPDCGSIAVMGAPGPVDRGGLLSLDCFRTALAAKRPATLEVAHPGASALVFTYLQTQDGGITALASSTGGWTAKTCHGINDIAAPTGCALLS